MAVCGMKCIDLGSEAIKTCKNIFHLEKNLKELKKKTFSVLLLLQSVLK